MAEWWIWLGSGGVSDLGHGMCRAASWLNGGYGWALREGVVWARVSVEYCRDSSWLNGGHGWALRERVLWATVCVEYCRAAWWLNGGHGWALREGVLWARVNVEYCRTASWLSGGHGWAERKTDWYIGPFRLFRPNLGISNNSKPVALSECYYIMKIFNGNMEWLLRFISNITSILNFITEDGWMVVMNKKITS